MEGVSQKRGTKESTGGWVSTTGPSLGPTGSVEVSRP